MSEPSKTTLNPGSDAAMDAGCICPVLDNEYGRGYMGVSDVFVMRDGCPIHGHQAREVKYPSIDQIRHKVKFMSERGLATEEFRVTTKVHGTNARIRVSESGERSFGSKNQMIDSGHFGFVKWAKSGGRTFADVPAPYTIYGEWAGKGIQDGVTYDKCWIVFGVYSEATNKWYTDEVVTAGDIGAYRVSDFGVRTFTLDLSKLEECYDILNEWVLDIEKECPVGAYFGKEVIGEGLVLVPTSSNDPSLGFKVKGNAHATTKVSRAPKTDDESVAIGIFLSEVLTEARLQQGLSEVELLPENTAQFIKWVIADVIKEDIDLVPDGANTKKFTGAIGPVAAKWFINKCSTGS